MLLIANAQEENWMTSFDIESEFERQQFNKLLYHIKHNSVTTGKKKKKCLGRIAELEIHSLEPK